jgi:hypothetical protein
MSNYPSKNLTGRPVSSSYVNLTQLVSGSILVDGLGNSIIDISTITASNSSVALYSNGSAGSSNYSLTASYVSKLVGINDYFDKSDNTTVAFATLSELTLNLQQSLIVYINNTEVVFNSGSSITMPATLLAGNDYGIYATTDNNLIATYTNTGSNPMEGYTVPAGYTVDNSRLIGGFYFSHSGSTPISTISRSRVDNTATLELVAGSGIITGDTVDVTMMTDLTYNSVDTPVTVTGNNISFYSSGSDEGNTADTAGRVWKVNNVGIINQYSLWDLKFRPVCGDARGMVLVDNKFWVDIWLTGVNYLTKGSSRKGERIADGEATAASYPLISTRMGGNGTSNYGNCTWFSATEVASHWGKQLLSETDFQIAAYGTSEAAAYGTDPQFTCRNTVFTSKWGLEQASGVMYVWGSDLNYRFESGTATYIATSIRSRDSSSVASITCSTAHNLSVGEAISITGFTDTAGLQYNRFTTVTSVPSSTSFTYNCASGSLGEGPTSSSVGLVQAGSLPAYNWVNQGGGRGQLYIQGPYGFVAGVYGGVWNVGIRAGSRCSAWNRNVWDYNSNIGLRCRCDHLVTV